jgi:O-antigen/teichoic acid export membrane protein
MGPDVTTNAGTGFGPSGRLRDHASRGAMWTVGMQWSIRISAFVTFVVLGRLLAPQDFGAIALASTLTLILSAFADFGFSAYLVQASDPTRRDISTAFWFSAAAGALLAVGLAVCAWPLAELLGAPGAAPVFAAVSLSVLLDSLKGVPTALLKRRFDFRALAVRRIVAVLIGQVVAIVLAVTGAGVWALVGQVWTVSVVSLVATWVVVGWRPSLQFSVSTARSIARYGVNVLGSDLVWNGMSWVTDGIVSRVLGLQQLGYLVMANRVVQMTVDTAVVTGQQVAVSLFASIKHQRDRLVNAYLTSLALATSLLVPGLLALALNSHLLVPGLLGDKWLPAVPLFELVAIAGAARALGVVDPPLLLGTGRPRMLFGLRLTTAVLIIGSTAVLARVSVEAVAAGFAVVYTVMAPVQLLVMGRVLGIGAWRVFGTVLPIVGISLLAIAPAALWTWRMEDVAAPLVVTAVSLLIAAATQLLLLRVLRRAVWSTMRGMATSLLARRRRRSGAPPEVVTTPGG